MPAQAIADAELAPPECRTARSATRCAGRRTSATPTPPPMQKPWIMAIVGFERVQDALLRAVPISS